MTHEIEDLGSCRSARCEVKFSSFWIYPIIFILLLVIYSPVFIIPYAFLDTYLNLAAVKQHKLSEVLRAITLGGRPLYELFCMAVFNCLRGIGDLGYLRAFGVIGIGAIAALVYRSLSCTALPRLIALSGALLFGLLPAYQVYAAWAVCSPFPWACVLAALAFNCCRGVDDLRLGPGWMRLCGSIVLLTTCMAIYQPAGMVFWVFAAINWLLYPNLPSVKSVAIAGTVMSLAMALNYSVLKLVPLALWRTGNDYSRTALVHNYAEKLHWFFQKPLISSLNIFSIHPSGKFSWVIIALTLVGFLLFFGSLRQALPRIGIAALLIPASYAPNLIVAENFGSYRTQVGLGGLVLVYVIIAVVGWVRLLHIHRWIPALCLIALIGGALIASRNVMLGFAVPQAVEYRLVENGALNIKFHQDDNIYLKTARWQGQFFPSERYDEFGRSSSSAGYAASAMLWLILKERHSPYVDLFAIDQPNSARYTPFPGCKKIDLDNILNPR